MAWAMTRPAETQPMPEWLFDQAGANFEAIVDAAGAGTHQVIRRRDGKQVVVVSRDDFDPHQPNLRDYLLTSGYADKHDEFDDALRTVRESAATFFLPRAPTFET
jgi:hypothetical protein